MARTALTVIPGFPHHVTQRGNGRARTLFDDDHRFYRDRPGSECRAAGVAVAAWVPMPNHVRLILIPTDEDGLTACEAIPGEPFAACRCASGTSAR